MTCADFCLLELRHYRDGRYAEHPVFFLRLTNGLKGLGHPVSAGMGQEVHIA